MISQRLAAKLLRRHWAVLDFAKPNAQDEYLQPKMVSTWSGMENKARNIGYYLLAELKDCISTKNLERGRQMHEKAVDNGLISDIYVATALVNMYAKCRSIGDARQVFDSIGYQDVVSWTAIISGYADNGEGTIALDMFTRMRSQGYSPDSWTFVAALKSCTSLGLNEGAECRDRGKALHSLVFEDGCINIYTQSILIDIYSKCGRMIDARQVFDCMSHRNVVSWTSLILGYADNGEGATALNIFARMIIEGHRPNSWTFVAALKACTSLLKQDGNGWAECRAHLYKVRDLVFEDGCCSDIFVQNTLIDLCAKCGLMVEARQLFDSMSHRNAVSWTALISGYADNGKGTVALDMFMKMRSQGCLPDSLTFVAAIKACTSLAFQNQAIGMSECRNRGKEIHDLASNNGCNSDVYLQSTLIDMYSKCGNMVDAHQVFDSMKSQSTVSWSVLISGYAANGDGETALNMFTRMRSRGCSPDSSTFMAALKACASLALKQEGGGKTECRDRGKVLQDLAVENGCISDIYVQNNFIDMYAKCGNMFDARQMFDCMQQQDVIAWTALILGYADNGQGVTALEMFTSMRYQGCLPNSWTFAAVFKACGLLGALEFGRKIHAEIGIQLDLILVTCLVDFYAKCGSLVESQEVFKSNPRTRDLATWSALLAGHSRLGDSKTVFELFEGLQDAGFQPDAVTFTCILACCSHAGLLEKGKQCFEAMYTRYGITPTAEHYTCMVDNFGRCNKLDDALALLQSMPCRPDAVAWTALLAACHKWKNVQIGRLAFKSLLSYDSRNAGAYVLMAHIFESKGMWQEHEIVIGKKKSLNAWKQFGESSWTNEAGEVHKFFAGDSNHPQQHEIQRKLEAMVVAIRERGYVADIDMEKEEALCGHSEKLAIVCALINTEPEKTIRIVKNDRVCDGCHGVAAVISKLEKRIIICRDANRFHVFQDGNCSCGDFW